MWEGIANKTVEEEAAKTTPHQPLHEEEVDLDLLPVTISIYEELRNDFQHNVHQLQRPAVCVPQQSHPD